MKQWNESQDILSNSLRPFRQQILYQYLRRQNSYLLLLVNWLNSLSLIATAELKECQSLSVSISHRAAAVIKAKLNYCLHKQCIEAAVFKYGYRECGIAAACCPIAPSTQQKISSSAKSVVLFAGQTKPRRDFILQYPMTTAFVNFV